MPDPRPPASKNLVTTDWLAARLGEPDIVVVDGSFYLPALKRDAGGVSRGHIPGAVFFDIDAIADHSTDLPHMLPGTTQFAMEVGALGIGRDDTIVVYDGAGLVGAPRVWWTFRDLRREERLHPRRRLAEVESRRPPARAGKASARRASSSAELNTGVVAGVATCRWR